MAGWLGIGLALAGCDAFRVHPYAVPQDDAHRDRTEKNLRRLAAIEPGETFVFAVLGDSQRWQDEVPPAVKSVNADPSVAFAIHVGDITEFGLAREYVWQNEYHDELDVPLLTVVGNHDLLGNGGTIYDSVFGPRNYTFLFGRTKFVMLDTNGREYGFNGSVPDIAWLERELLPDPTWDEAIVVGHVPPDNGDFDRQLEEPYYAALYRWGNVVLSLHGHVHSYREEFLDDGNILLVTADKMEARTWTRITVGPDGIGVIAEEVPF